MNLILLEAGDLDAGGSRARLQGRRLRHAREILGAGSGDRLRVGIVDGDMGFGTVIRDEPDVLELEVVLDQAPPPPLPATVLLALPRPKALKRVLQGLAAMGVKDAYLMNAVRVEKSYWQSPGMRPEAVREQLVLGLEQARDTVVPNVHLRQRFKPFVEDEVPALARATTALVAHPDAEGPCPRAVAGPVTLAIGPEGGFVQYEVDLLRAQGFRAVSLGARRLRVEQAVAALLGRLF